MPAPHRLAVSVYFPKFQVHTEGPSKAYDRGSDAGRKVEFHFCPDCGSTVFWHAEFAPHMIGIAFGAFADPSTSWRPTKSGWEATGHSWAVSITSSIASESGETLTVRS